MRTTGKDATTTTAAAKRRRRSNAILLELNESEREKLEWLKDQRGERATLASTLRDLILQARK
jgi:hypothetical protein